MSRLLERLLMWFADLLDRSLLAVPEEAAAHLRTDPYGSVRAGGRR